MVEFIAEISSNHNQDIDRAKKLIDSAFYSGFRSVKFQYFRINKLFSKDVLKNSKQHRDREKWELPKSFVPELSNYARSKSMKFGVTPFDTDSLDFLKDHVDFFKIASYEILYLDLIKEVSKYNMPTIISTGMANIQEIDKAVNAFKCEGNNNLSLMHCVSSYPTPAEQTNLSAIVSLKDRYDIDVGWSDHTVNESVIYHASLKYGAQQIELHIDIDNKGYEADSGHCWLPEKSKKIIDNINNGFRYMGNGKKSPVQSEMADRDWRSDPSDGLRPLIILRKNEK